MLSLIYWHKEVFELAAHANHLLPFPKVPSEKLLMNVCSVSNLQAAGKLYEIIGPRMGPGNLRCVARIITNDGRE